MKTTKKVIIGGKTIKQLDKPTKEELEILVDYMREGIIAKLETENSLENTIDRFIDKFGINAEWSNIKIINAFNKLITNTVTRDLPGTVKN